VIERPFERGSDCWGVRSNLLPKSQSGFQGSGRVKWPQRTGTRTRPGSLDSAGRGAHRTPTGGPNLAAVGEQESKYGNDGSKLAGGDRTLARRAPRPNTTARKRPSDAVMDRAHRGHHFGVRLEGTPKGVVEPALLENLTPHKNEPDKPPSGPSGGPKTGVPARYKPPSRVENF
jgi:hypothetical protein